MLAKLFRSRRDRQQALIAANRRVPDVEMAVALPLPDEHDEL